MSTKKITPKKIEGNNYVKDVAIPSLVGVAVEQAAVHYVNGQYDDADHIAVDLIAHGAMNAFIPRMSQGTISKIIDGGAHLLAKILVHQGYDQIKHHAHHIHEHYMEHLHDSGEIIYQTSLPLLCCIVSEQLVKNFNGLSLFKKGKLQS